MGEMANIETRDQVLHLWRADEHLVKPVLVACPDGRYPATDADGHRIYLNSHFDSEEEAWTRLFDEISAGVSLAGRDVMAAEDQLRKAQELAGDAAKQFAKLRDNNLDRQIELAKQSTEQEASINE